MLTDARKVLPLVVVVLFAAGCSVSNVQDIRRLAFPTFEEQARDLCLSESHREASYGGRSVTGVDASADSEHAVVSGDLHQTSVERVDTSSGTVDYESTSTSTWTCVVDGGKVTSFAFDKSKSDGPDLSKPADPKPAMKPAVNSCIIKGNVSYNTGERIYHVPGQAYYDETVIDERYGERWFCTEKEAKAAGWRKSRV